jgi:hypothetical protein
MSSEMDRASEILSWAGMRLMELDGVMTVGLWSDLDCPEIREALRVFGSGEAPVRYLDGPSVPDRFKLRRVAGDPVPLSVLAEMEQHSEEPWKVRNELLLKMDWHQASSWNVWVRRRNDRIFLRDAALHEPDDPEAWFDRQYYVAHAWALWMQWRERFPEEADRWRREYAGDRGDLNWLLEGFAGLDVVCETTDQSGRCPITLAGSGEKQIDPQTGIWPISEWGAECGRGLVSDARFGYDNRVIKRTNRATSRKWRRLDATTVVAKPVGSSRFVQYELADDEAKEQGA